MPGLSLWLSSSGLARVSIRVPELAKAPAVSLPTLRVKRSPKEKAMCEGEKESRTRGVASGLFGYCCWWRRASLPLEDGGKFVTRRFDSWGYSFR